MRSASLAARVGVTLLVLAIMGWSAWHIIATERLARYGAEAQAEVGGVRNRRGPDILPTKPYVMYEYRVGERLIRGEVSVPESARDRLLPGTRIEIRYDRSFPSRHVAIPYGLADLHDWKKYALLLGSAALALGYTWRRSFMR